MKKFMQKDLSKAPNFVNRAILIVGVRKGLPSGCFGILQRELRYRLRSEYLGRLSQAIGMKRRLRLIEPASSNGGFLQLKEEAAIAGLIAPFCFSHSCCLFS